MEELGYDIFWYMVRLRNTITIDFRNVCQKNQTYYRVAFLPPATQKTKNPIKQN